MSSNTHDDFLKEILKMNKESAILSESALFNEKKLIPFDVLGLNIAFSGDVDGGMGSGLHFFAAPSKHFKTLFGLLAVNAYLNENPDGVVLFYDSEFGTTLSYWKAARINMARVVHIPVRNVEDFKFDLVQKLEKISETNKKNKEKRKVMILIDSVGNMASKKEIEDALNDKSVADMTRAKMLKGVFRMVTPYFTLEEIPCVAINHVYSEIGLFPKTIMGGGTGGTYSATNIFFISKSQEKTQKEGLMGFTFKIKAEKSRYIKEGSIIPVTVNFKGGMSKYTGLFDIALETGDIVSPSQGRYSRVLVNPDTGEILDDDKSYWKKEMDTEFFKVLLSSTQFKENVRKMYRLSDSEIVANEEADAAELEDEEDGET